MTNQKKINYIKKDFNLNTKIYYCEQSYLNIFISLLIKNQLILPGKLLYGGTCVMECFKLRET